jgi:hypothetical protein
LTSAARSRKLLKAHAPFPSSLWRVLPAVLRNNKEKSRQTQVDDLPCLLYPESFLWAACPMSSPFTQNDLSCEIFHQSTSLFWAGCQTWLSCSPKIMMMMMLSLPLVHNIPLIFHCPVSIKALTFPGYIRAWLLVSFLLLAPNASM